MPVTESMQASQAQSVHLNYRSTCACTPLMDETTKPAENSSTSITAAIALKYKTKIFATLVL